MDGTCLTIMGAMGTAILGMAGYIVYLQKTLNAVQESRVRWMQDQLALMRTLRDEFRKPPDKPKGGRP
jgi:hypothetical protein